MIEAIDVSAIRERIRQHDAADESENSPYWEKDELLWNDMESLARLYAACFDKAEEGTDCDGANLYLVCIEDIARNAEAQNAALRAELEKAHDFIRKVGEALHNRRAADWYPEGAHNAASDMSEAMRVIGNECAEFEA